MEFDLTLWSLRLAVASILCAAVTRSTACLTGEAKPIRLPEKMDIHVILNFAFSNNFIFEPKEMQEVYGKEGN